MKYKIIFFCIALVIMQTVIAQKKGNAKLYAFMQPVAGGAAPTGEISLGGKTTNNEPETRANYFLYVSYNSTSEQIQPSEIWINGKRYKVKYETVNKTPVTYKSTDPAAKNITLVPKTTSKVMMLSLAGDAKDGKSFLKSTSIAKNNSVVLVYKYNGSYYYTALPQMKKLATAHMQ